MITGRGSWKGRRQWTLSNACYADAHSLWTGTASLKNTCSSGASQENIVYERDFGETDTGNKTFI